MQVMGRELEVPAQFASLGIQRHDTVRIEVVAGTLAAVGVGERIPGGPINQMQVGVVAACEPRGAAAELDRVALPRVRTGLTLAWDGPKAPRKLARRRLVSGDEAADAVISAGNPCDYGVVHY